MVATSGNDMPMPTPSFWGSVVAGTMVVLGIGALSEFLMFGCRVGVYRNGAPDLGAGAAIWMIITSCIAYFVGGLVASQLSLNGTWLHGIVLWGFSIPLSLLIGAAVTVAAGTAYAHTTDVTEQVLNSSGAGAIYNGNVFVSFAGAWAAFLSVILGLIFAVLGSTAGACACAQGMSRRVTEIPPRN
jgi:hypothetical protein